MPMKYFWMVKKRKKNKCFFVFFINVLYFSCYTSQGDFVLCGQVAKDVKTKTFSLIVMISVVVKGW